MAAIESLIAELQQLTKLDAVARGLALRKMLGASRPQSDLRIALGEAMAELRDAGMSHAEIARTQGVARQQITRALSRS